MPDGSGSGSGSGVVGAKEAGATAALTVRAEGHTGRDTLIRAHDEAPYRRPGPRSIAGAGRYLRAVSGSLVGTGRRCPYSRAPFNTMCSNNRSSPSSRSSPVNCSTRDSR